jgi:hypothetical protein
MSLDVNPFKKSVGTLISINIGEATVQDMINIFNKILDDNVPSGKVVSDFTGGYIQQMANSNQLVLYFGYKWDEKKQEFTTNRDTVKLDVASEELDLFYIGLKAKIIEMKFTKKKGKNKSVSMMDIFGTRETTSLDTAKAIPNKVCDEKVIIPEITYNDTVCEDCGQPYSQCVC